MHVHDIDSEVGGTVVGLVVTVDVPVVPVLLVLLVLLLVVLVVVIAGHSFIGELTLQVDSVTELLPEYSVYRNLIIIICTHYNVL